MLNPEYLLHLNYDRLLRDADPCGLGMADKIVHFFAEKLAMPTSEVRYMIKLERQWWINSTIREFKDPVNRAFDSFHELAKISLHEVMRERAASSTDETWLALRNDLNKFILSHIVPRWFDSDWNGLISKSVPNKKYSKYTVIQKQSV